VIESGHRRRFEHRGCGGGCGRRVGERGLADDAPGRGDRQRLTGEQVEHGLVGCVGLAGRGERRARHRFGARRPVLAEHQQPADEPELERVAGLPGVQRGDRKHAVGLAADAEHRQRPPAADRAEHEVAQLRARLGGHRDRLLRPAGIGEVRADASGEIKVRVAPQRPEDPGHGRSPDQIVVLGAIAEGERNGAVDARGPGEDRGVLIAAGGVRRTTRARLGRGHGGRRRAPRRPDLGGVVGGSERGEELEAVGVEVRGHR
jgi:hypothetical protein